MFKFKWLNLNKKLLFWSFMVNSNITKQRLDKIVVLKYIEVKSWWKINLNITLNTNGR